MKTVSTCLFAAALTLSHANAFAQDLPANTPPMLEGPGPLVLECANLGGTMATISAMMTDAENDALSVEWRINGHLIKNDNLAGAEGVRFSMLSARFRLGTNSVHVAITDGHNAPVEATTEVVVQDTIAPAIVQLRAMPGMLLPTNGRMVPVRLHVRATDACGPVKSRIKWVTSDVAGKKSGHPDWVVTGPLSLLLRAERGARETARTYTIAVECTDRSGNAVMKTVNVLVPGRRQSDE